MTVVGVRGHRRPEPAFVIADSQLERTAVETRISRGGRGGDRGAVASAVEGVGGERIGRDARVPLLRRGRAALGRGLLHRPRRRRRQRRPDPAPDPDRRGDRPARGAGRRLARRRGPRPAAAPTRAGRGEGRRRRLLRPDPGRLQRRGRPARDHASTRCRSASRSSTALARSSSPTPRTSCARRSSRSSGFVELLADEDPDPEARAEFVARDARPGRPADEADRRPARPLEARRRRDSDPARARRPRRGRAAGGRPSSGRLADQHGSEITIEGGSRGAATADPERVAQIMRILIDNALTHTPEGTAIKVGTQTAPSNGSASVRVTDDGPGIEPRARERIFERFYTGDEVSGSGLGLAIARELALRMDGSLGAQRPPRAHRVRARAAGGAAMTAPRPRASRLRSLAAAALAGRLRLRRQRDDHGHRRPVDHDDRGRRLAAGRDRGRGRRLRRPRDLRGGGARRGHRDLGLRRHRPGILGGGGGGGGQGSGFVISEEGEILTNAHVVTDAATTGSPTRPLHEATQIYIQFADRNQVEAEIVGFDPFADVALLKVDPEGLDLQSLPLGSETDVQVGDAVAAIGSPFGQNQSLSVGRGVGGRPLDRVADRLPDRRRAADRRLDQPRQLRRPAAQRRRRGGRASTSRSRPPPAAARGSASRSRSTSPSARSDQLRDDGEVAYAYAGVTTQPLYPQLAERLGIDDRDRARWSPRSSRARRPTTPACRPATKRSASRAAR